MSGEEADTHNDDDLYPCWGCGKAYTQWCNDCDVKKLVSKFGEWTSGNEAIDKVIQESQRKEKQFGSYLEWCEPHEFTDIQHLANGGFGSTYTAIWARGPVVLKKIKASVQKPVRTGPTKVVLKTLHNSDITDEFLDEFARLRDYGINEIALTKTYGITKHPETHEYAYIMEHYNLGNFYSILKNNIMPKSWLYNVATLTRICLGLETLHRGNVAHCDLHGGNILFTKTKGEEAIDDAALGDFGLCRQVTESAEKQEGIYGVIPYMAPELFQGKPHSLKSDIYALGILMWELSSRRPVFSDRSHDISLVLNICNGLRPDIVEGTPSRWTELMQKCWHQDPSERPDMETIISKYVKDWGLILEGTAPDHDGIKNHFNDADVYLSQLQMPVNSGAAGAVYTSKFVPTVTDEIVVEYKTNCYSLCLDDYMIE